MSKNGNGVTPAFDFSHLYITETVQVTNHAGAVVFEVTVGEVTHGEKTDGQTLLMQEIDIPTRGSKAEKERLLQDEMKRAMQNGVTGKMSIHDELSAIKSWTLKDATGEAVPVCESAWRNLPVYMTAQVEKVIERLNPSLDEEFQGER